MESYFEVPVLFNQVHNAIVFDRRDLQLPIPTADAQVYELIKQQLTAIADASGVQKSFEARVVHEIKRSLGSRYDNLIFVAEQMGLHPRRLQRDLQARGSSFQALLKQVKVDTAMDYLQQSDISISELSDFLGYQNVSAFSRAFKRDVGVSPDMWKKANKPA
jgi:AraC-like DNA-binding protein